MWRRYVGVTLVELLVVVALMLLIMSILLPAGCKLYRIVEAWRH